MTRPQKLPATVFPARAKKLPIELPALLTPTPVAKPARFALSARAVPESATSIHGVVCSDATDDHLAERIADTETIALSIEGAAKLSGNGRPSSSIAFSGSGTGRANQRSRRTPTKFRVGGVMITPLEITQAGLAACDGILVATGPAATSMVTRDSLRLRIGFTGKPCDMSVGLSTKISLGSTHLAAVTVANSMTTLARHVTLASRG
jgi:hypothetical protein